MGTWREEFEKRTDPRGFDYFWLTGYYHNEEPTATDTDEYMLSKGYISIVPIKIDLTDKEEVLNFQDIPFENADEVDIKTTNKTKL